MMSFTLTIEGTDAYSSPHRRLLKKNLTTLHDGEGGYQDQSLTAPQKVFQSENKKTIIIPSSKPIGESQHCYNNFVNLFQTWRGAPGYNSRTDCLCKEVTWLRLPSWFRRVTKSHWTDVVPGPWRNDHYCWDATVLQVSSNIESSMQ